ncbi:MAG: cryptochrome/photolyase family protein [Hyphomicrobiaceae bacterium]
MVGRPIVVWFRNDLRVADHPALAAAAATGRPIVPVFVLDDGIAGEWALGGASRWWLHHSLLALGQSLHERGTELILRRGNTRRQLCTLAHDSRACAVYCSRSFEPWAPSLENDLYHQLGDREVEFKRFSGSLLHDPDNLRTKAGAPFKVYTPFWRAMTAKAANQRSPIGEPEAVVGFDGSLDCDKLAEWELLPTHPDWSKGLRQAWVPGERAARGRLAEFLDDDASEYGRLRDRPDLTATSRLSPHLRFGEISPAVCWRAALLHADRRPKSAEGLEVFRKELAWREFSYHLLHHFPSLPDTPFKDQFLRFPWQSDDTRKSSMLRAWQRGRTGYPIVDAGMRELWATGWMHNRVRMIVASFLTKHLLQPWQAGEAWFWDCLVDADLASNAASWQWVAGCGADAAPYFRVFNPIIQSEKFDPKGAYIRKWVPEIADLPNKYIHVPWTAPAALLYATNIRLGESYPNPLVDHTTARARALSAYETIKR